MTEASIGFVFPGQGSQKVGMGQEWADAHDGARDAFAEANDVLGFDLTRLCWEGPDEELILTANTQPALLTVSIAMLRVVTDAGLRPVVVAGHSLGEYAALVAAGTLTFADALRLVRRRGELMQQAVPVGVGAMAALLALDDAAVAAVVAETLADRGDDEVLTLANLNAPGQVVIAGHRGAVEAALPVAESHGARRAKLLPVSAPFHSPLMAPARAGLEPLLAETTFVDPAVPVVTNIDAQPITSGAVARDALARQIDGPVRWVESMRYLVDEAGIGTVVEVGPGSVLCGLGRRIDRGVAWRNLPNRDALDRLVDSL